MPPRDSLQLQDAPSLDFPDHWTGDDCRFNRKRMFEGHSLVSTGLLIDADKGVNDQRVLTKRYLNDIFKNPWIYLEIVTLLILPIRNKSLR
jgi:hypothetical protein